MVKTTIPGDHGNSAPAVALVAIDESGDRLGAPLMAAIKARTGGAARFFGVGGVEMAAEGLNSLFPIDDLSLIGHAYLPRLLLTMLRRIRQAADAICEAHPDVLVIVDCPDFTHRVARRVRARAPAIPIVDFVSPQVWAWRPGRARRMRNYVDHVLAVLPFEPAVHRKLGGPPCTFVGHPAAERVTDLRPNREEELRRRTDPPIVLALPGSRSSEIRRLLAVFGEALSVVDARVGPIEVVLPTLPHLREEVSAAIASWAVTPRLVTSEAEKRAAFRCARAALTKSGTVTLELALAGVPMVAAYKVSKFDAWIARRLVRVPSFILANLVLGGNVVPEKLQEECTAEGLAAALVPLIRTGAERQRQIESYASLDAIMQIGEATPSARASEVILRLAGTPDESSPTRIARLIAN